MQPKTVPEPWAYERARDFLTLQAGASPEHVLELLAAMFMVVASEGGSRAIEKVQASLRENP